MKLSRLLTFILSAILAVTTAVTASAAFSKTKTYNGSFTDVAQDAWYAKEIASAYELGFMEGMSDTAFSPSTTVTVAQGITMASRVHGVYTGKTIGEVPGGQWYDMYVKYAKDNGIIDENQFDSYTRELKRFEMAELFHDAMPEGYFNAINDVDYIPDVPMGAMYQDKLLTLYNAGIVMGSDDYGTFNPDASIVRSECAAIINRVAIPENRVKGELIPFTSDNAYTLCYNTSMEGSVEGINSGWILDNRGGDAKITNTAFSTVKDVSEKYATAWIREFNFIPKGEIVLETKIEGYADGMFAEYRDVKGDTVYMLKVIDGVWNILGKDGKFTPVLPDFKLSKTKAETYLRVSINLDTGKSTTFINNTACESSDLLSDNIMSYSVGIDEKGMGEVKMSFVNMVVNYSMYEDFDFFGAHEVYGWKTTGDVTHSSSQLNFGADSSAVKTFRKTQGIVCTEAYFYTKDGADFNIDVGDALTVKSVGKKLYAGDKEMYTVTPDMWYRLRVEADTQNGTAVVYLNGQNRTEVKTAKSESIESLGITSKGEASFDRIRVYTIHEYDDYVPEPCAKASMDDYIVGLNICSLWRNGTHYGWACISAYDEPTPVLGYYDEGLPETADWEIKFMTEHGIDFQAFCWYADVSEGAIKHPRQGEQLHDGYKYAKYSDYMKYCLLFEAQGSKPFDSKQFRNYVVPYWFENYFLDNRYLTVENNLVLAVYGAERLAGNTYFGSAEGVKAELDYLEGKAKEYGFDGVLYFCCGTSNETLQNMGFDATIAYNWMIEGKNFEHNKERIIASNNYGGMYTIPTISVGFDSIPWHGKRNGLMTVEDYEKSMTWVKNVYLPAQSKQPSWTKNLVWLSTWNEYGEGTYIMPSGHNGFGYLDVLRSAYTSLPKDHRDVTPTLKQRERINHLYPQYAHLLRRDGWYTFNATAADKKNEAKNKLFVNGRDVLASSFSEIPPTVENGTVFYPFEPATCLNYIMNIHYEWRKEAGTLLIEANGHSVKMLAGSDRYMKDGVESSLGYTMKLVDNIPMLDYKKLCDDLGYTCEEKDGNLYIFSDNYQAVWEKFSSRKTGTYEFESDDTEGWESGNMTLSVKDGALHMVNSTDSRDPILYLSKNSFPEDFHTGKYTGVEMRVRYKYDGEAIHQLCIYYTTDVDSKWSESKSHKVVLDSTDSGDGWETITMDFSEDTNWKLANRLTGLRLDPFNAQGTMEVDYIRFVENPDFVYLPDMRYTDLKNGNAEDEFVTFYSHNAKVTRVEDPYKEGNHMWFVDCAAGGKQWTYFKHAYEFNEGSTYKIDFDIKLAGNNADVAEITESSYCVNLKYDDKGAQNDLDHIVVSNRPISVYNGWVHYSAEYKVEKVDSNDRAEFTIYVNPTGEVAFDYYIDNLVIREVGSEGWEDVEIVINDNPEGSIPKPPVDESLENLPPAVLGVISVNGSADSDDIPFYSHNAEISIVTDPDNADNRVFLVNPKLGKNWTYFKYLYSDIRKGVIYKISYDIKFAGNNVNDTSITSGRFDTNIQYNSPVAANGKDHTAGAKNFSASDGWVHEEVTHTVDVITDNKASSFSIFANPVGDVSISYYIDNFAVEIVGGENVAKASEAGVSGSVIPSMPKPGIISVGGDAEGEGNPFVSHNAEISRVADPDDTNNNVWLVKSKLGKNWTYFKYPYTKLQKDVTYKISYDIKFAGNNANDSSIVSGRFNTNVQYASVGTASVVNHTGKAKSFSSSDGWIHEEFTHTVEAVSTNKDNCFAIFTDPVGDISIDYYIDNFTVEIVAG